MLTIMKDFPPNVLAVRASGNITKEDYDNVLIPAATKMLEEREKIRLYYDISSEFAGIDAAAMWQDCKLGFEYLTRWERAAIVTDIEWIRLTMGAFSFLFPIKVFSLSEEAQARQWITEK